MAGVGEYGLCHPCLDQLTSIRSSPVTPCSLLFADKESKQGGGPAKTFKIKKHKLKKWLLPLLVGYKLKFMTLVPLLFATLALLVASAGFAGFFFAMFTAALTLPKSGGHH